MPKNLANRIVWVIFQLNWYNWVHFKNQQRRTRKFCLMEPCDWFFFQDGRHYYKLFCDYHCGVTWRALFFLSLFFIGYTFSCCRFCAIEHFSFRDLSVSFGVRLQLPFSLLFYSIPATCFLHSLFVIFSPLVHINFLVLSFRTLGP